MVLGATYWKGPKLESMYMEVYVEMTTNEIAAKLDTALWLNKAGEIVEYENLSFSRNPQVCASPPLQILVCV